MDFSDLEDKLLFAIPKKGRLYETCLNLLKGADLQFHRKNRLDIALCSNLPVVLVFLPAKDIAKYVGDGNVDLGITGIDMVAEAGVSVTQLLQLGFGKCNLCFQVPQDSAATSPADLVGKRIVTSFEHVVKKYFYALESGKDHASALACLADKSFVMPSSAVLKTQVNQVSGSVEAACALGLADAIVDLVESGETMRAAKLKSIGVLLESQAILMCNPRRQNPLVDKIKRRIQGVIAAQRYVLCNYNVQRASLSEAVKITPGRKAPTVSPLEDDTWVAVSSMVLKSSIADIMDQLTAVGAQDILVFDIHNCRVD